jgi:hypothetical protein
MKKHVDICFKFISTCFKFSAISNFHRSHNSGDPHRTKTVNSSSLSKAKWCTPRTDVHLEDFEFKDEKTNKQKKQQATIRRFFPQFCEVGGLVMIKKKT